MRRIAKTPNPEAAPLGQMVMPMVTGILRTRQSLFSFVQEAGLLVLLEIFNQDAEKMAGEKGRWNKRRGAFISPPSSPPSVSGSSSPSRSMRPPERG